MQTFVPYPSFERSAAVLDDRRLGKQRVEALQILRALTRERYGWKHHPAVLMWRGHEEALARYGLVVCAEWRRRGHADTCEATIRADFEQGTGRTTIRSERALSQLRRTGLPAWWGDERVHASHRSSLLAKDPDHYRAFFGPEHATELPYHWPVRRAESGAGLQNDSG